MARPTNKPELLDAVIVQFQRMWDFVSTMSETELTVDFPLEDRDRNLRDVLAHVLQWQVMMLDWYQIGVIEGGLPNIPGRGYTWRTTPSLNAEIREQWQNVPLAAVKIQLRSSHSQIVELIEGHTQEELFDRGIYKWTKASTLGAYFIGATSSHYDWAVKKLRRQVKAMRK